MTGPLVTAAIVVRNGERFLAEAIESLLGQTHRPLDPIVVDDGSTDSSARIAERYPVQLRRTPPQGMAAARNEAVAAARGELVAFLDADDLWHPEKLARQVALLAALPDVGILHVHAVVELLEGVERPPWIREEELVVPHLRHAPSSMLMRRSVLAAVGPFDSRYAIMNDADWLLRARQLGVRDEVLAEPLLRYRVHGANSMHAARARLSETLALLRAGAARSRTLLERVCVVVPVRDGAAYLAEALASIEAQTSRPDEVVVVDDGSRDGSLEIAERFAPLVRCVSQPPLGAAAARNRGLAESDAPLVAFLDADDLWLPRKLEVQLAALRADPGLDVVAGHVCQFVSPDLDTVAAARLVCPPEPQAGPLTATGLMRRSAIERVGPFAEDFVLGDTFEWAVRARDAGLRERLLPDVLVRRRLHTANTWRRRRPQAGELAVALKRSLDRRRASPEQP